MAAQLLMRFCCRCLRCCAGHPLCRPLEPLLVVLVPVEHRCTCLPSLRQRGIVLLASAGLLHLVPLRLAPVLLLLLASCLAPVLVAPMWVMQAPQLCRNPRGFIQFILQLLPPLAPSQAQGPRRCLVGAEEAIARLVQQAAPHQVTLLQHPLPARAVVAAFPHPPRRKLVAQAQVSGELVCLCHRVKRSLRLCIPRQQLHLAARQLETTMLRMWLLLHLQLRMIAMMIEELSVSAWTTLDGCAVQTLVFGLSRRLLLFVYRLFSSCCGCSRLKSSLPCSHAKA